MKKLAFFFTILLFLLAACAPAKKGLSQEIVGTWKNSEGFLIQFQPGDKGFIPGVAGKIPDSNFTYSVLDETHIQVELMGQKQTIEVTIDGDNLTWNDTLGQVSYTRVK